MIDDRTSALVQILADTDAVFWPERDASSTWRRNAWSARRDFADYGVPWIGGGGEAGRQRVHRMLEALVDEGAVTVKRRRREKLPYVKLTEASYDATRKLVGEPSAYCGWLSLRLLEERSKRPPEFLTDLWVSESTLLSDGEQPTAIGLHAVAAMALPALVAGWLESNTDIPGWRYFAITDAGWKVLEGPDPPDEEKPPHDPEAAALYVERFDEARDRLARSVPADPQNIGSIPLPASMQGVRIAR